MILHRRTIRLSVGDEPPREFRIFEAGENDSSQGSVTFDASSARAVMRLFERQGVDLMIDLEHLSLDSESRSYDPDARGWCKLEVRDGELWAVDVRWTPEGARRLREKRQRYVSPAFYADKKGRVTEIVNVAICAMPATHDAPALVAANRRARRAQRAAARRRSKHMDPKMMKDALEALKSGDGEKALAVLEACIAAAAGADDEAVPDDEALADDEHECADDEHECADDKHECADDEHECADDEEAVAKRKRASARAASAASESARVIAAMSAEITKLKRRSQRDDVRELVRANADRIPLALEKWALAQTPETLSEYIKHAPVAARVAQPPQQRDEAAELTPEDREVCRLTGNDPAKVLEFKRANARKVV